MEQLRVAQEGYTRVQAEGGEIVAVTNDSPDVLKEGAEKHGIKFVLLSDPKALAARIYRIEHKGLNVTDAEATGARPAVFIINRDLTLSSAYQPLDFRHHLSADEMVSRVKEAK